VREERTAAQRSGPSARQSLPAFEVKVADTTGTGDAFDAGFIAARMRGVGLGRCPPMKRL